MDWFTSLIWGEEEVEVPDEPTVPADLLRSLAHVPMSDTMVTRFGWPLLSLDVAGDLERLDRLRASATLVTSGHRQLPFAADRGLRIIYREGYRPESMIAMARRFTDVLEVIYDPELPLALAQAEPVPTVVVAADQPGAAVGNLWYTSLHAIDSIAFVHFGDPGLVDIPAGWAWINAPLRSKDSEVVVAQALLGAETLTGRLADGRGEDLAAVRGGFRNPEELNIDRYRLADVDNTLQRAIRYRATPGAQLTVIKDGQVVYERSYGFHRYAKREPVRVSDLYDLASVTKVAATTLAVMKLYDEGRIKLDATVAEYLPEYAGRVPGYYRIDQLLTHHTGLQSGLPIYPYLNDRFIHDRPDATHGLALSPTKYLDDRTPDLLRHSLDQVDYTRRPSFRYSDVNYVLLQLIVESISGQPLDEFVTEQFYRPLGLDRLTFRPRESRFAEEQTVPTMIDQWIGRGELRGYVHDEGAAMLGGVGGHAGLFGNAHDVARLFQLLLDGGKHGDRQLLSETTVELFTNRGPYNHRALGFDRLAESYGSVMHAGASDRTFGHTGFTGTCVWADPDEGLIFVLLTNRIYPDPANKQFFKLGIRSRVHRAVYRALNTYTAHPA